MMFYIFQLEKFFEKENVSPNLYKNIINRLKFQYKLKYKDLTNQNRKDWYTVFPESHSHIMKFKDIPFLGRLKLFVLINLGIYP